MKKKRPNKLSIIVGGLIGLVILCLLILTAITAFRDWQWQQLKSSIIASYKPNSISSLKDGYPAALAIAHKWNKDSYLTEVIANIDIQDNHQHFARGIYYFVSGQKESDSVLPVLIKSTGDLEIEDPHVNEAGQGMTSIDPYDFGRNTLSEEDILNIAWKSLGGKLNCTANVSSASMRSAGYDGQGWIIDYEASSFNAGTAFIDNATGVSTPVPQVNTNFCKMK